MTRFTACALVTLLLLVAAGCQTPPPADRWAAAVQNDELAQAGLTYYWRVHLRLDEKETLVKIWRLDENVYCLTSSNRVLAYDAMRGLPKWSSRLADPGQTVFTPCHANGVFLPPNPGAQLVINPPPREAYRQHDIVIFNTVTYAVILDRRDGQVLGRLDFTRSGFAANTGGACDGGLYYVGSVQGWYYGLELVTGIASWWRDAGGMISASPVLMSRSLVVASQGGTLVAAATGSQGNDLWRQNLGGAFSADFVAQERGVFAGNVNYSVYALDTLSGRQLWRFRSGGPILQPVQAGMANIYATANGDKFYAIDVAGGREKWTLPSGQMVLMERNNVAHVLNLHNELMVTDAATGRVSVIVPMTGLDVFVRNTGTPVIYAAGRYGLLACIRPLEAGYLTIEGLGTPTTAPAQEPAPVAAPAAPNP